MNSFKLFAPFALAALAATPTRAACRVQTAVVAANVVAVPVAVSVGVPVAEAAPYYYSYQALASQPLSLVSSDAVEAIAAKVVEKLRQPTGGSATNAHSTVPQSPAQQPPAAASLVAQKCARCHGGAEPRANLSLENLSRLDCKTRLTAVRAVLSETMPKDGPRLTPEEAGKVLEELTKESGK